MKGFYSFYETAKRVLKEKVSRKNAFCLATLIKSFLATDGDKKVGFFGVTFSFKSLLLVSRDRFF